jgi:hypothetical protein
MVIRIFTVLLLILATIAVLLGSLRILHDREIDRLWETLRAPPGTVLFDPDSVARLPEPAQRYLRHAIAPGTRLAQSVVVEMQGRIGLQPGADMLPFQASQIRLPNGLIWKATAEQDPAKGSDRCVAGEARCTGSWGIIPLVRASGVDVTARPPVVAPEAPLLLRRCR